METWTFDDHGDYGDGPWASEPDKAVWIDPTTDLDCMIHRNHCGALCGYVGVGPDHPMHGAPYNEAVYTGEHFKDRCFSHNDLRGRMMEAVEVHGGLTYADACQGSICHVAQPGRPSNVWWFGFDCAHSGDQIPYKMPARAILGPPFQHEIYRNFDYVKAEVESLAVQLTEIASDISDCVS